MCRSILNHSLISSFEKTKFLSSLSGATAQPAKKEKRSQIPLPEPKTRRQDLHFKVYS